MTLVRFAGRGALGCASRVGKSGLAASGLRRDLWRAAKMEVGAVQRMLAAERAGLGDNREVLETVRTPDSHARLDFRQQLKTVDAGCGEHRAGGVAAGCDQPVEMHEEWRDECGKCCRQLGALGRIECLVSSDSHQQIGALAQMRAEARLPVCPLWVALG